MLIILDPCDSLAIDTGIYSSAMTYMHVAFWISNFQDLVQLCTCGYISSTCAYFCMYNVMYVTFCRTCITSLLHHALCHNTIHCGFLSKLLVSNILVNTSMHMCSCHKRHVGGVEQGARILLPLPMTSLLPSSLPPAQYRRTPIKHPHTYVRRHVGNHSITHYGSVGHRSRITPPPTVLKSFSTTHTLIHRYIIHVMV